MLKANNSNNRNAIYAALGKYCEYMKQHKPSAGKCYHPSALDIHHNHGKCNALNDLRPRLYCSDDDGHMSGADDDEDVQTLSQMIEDEYTGVRDRNDVANRSIVDEALSLYKSMMDERCHASRWWWIVVVPMIVYYAKLPGHHRHCKEAALARFDSKRDNSVAYNHSSDHFRDRLDQRIQEAYTAYK